MFFDTVTRNVYKMGEPTENTESDTTDGFITLEVGAISDDSEFSGDAYGWARCFVTVCLVVRNSLLMMLKRHKKAINIIYIKSLLLSLLTNRLNNN